MKKILLVVLLVFIIGCGGDHVYHTYYGDIEIDTMEVAYGTPGTGYLFQRALSKKELVNLL